MELRANGSVESNPRHSSPSVLSCKCYREKEMISRPYALIPEEINEKM
jgi:hypothetical protein